jgi:hypothetical protein
VVVDKRRKSGDIRLPNLVSLQAQLVEGSLHVDCVPKDDHVNNESERPELILLSLPIAMTQFAPLAVEDGATQAVPFLTCDPIAPWPIFTLSCKSALTGRTFISIRFRIRKKDYAVPRPGGLGCHDARQIKLGQLHFRINERFLYEYDFGDLWQHQVRIEKRLEIETSRLYPVCVGGQWAGPPEDCGGPQAFLERRAAAPWRVRELLEDLLEDIKIGDTEALDYRLEELQPWQEWLTLHRFDRHRVNRQLRQYAEGGPEWMNSKGCRH